MTALATGARRHLPLMLMATLLLTPVLALPAAGPLAGMKTFALQAVGFGLLVMLVSRLTWSPDALRNFVKTGPNLALMLFVGWAGVSFMINAPATGVGRDMALFELFRLASGAAIFFAAMYRCSSRDHLNLWSKLLLAGGVAAALAGLVSYSSSEMNWATGAFGNPQLLAGFLVVLLPVAVVYAHQGEMDARRVLALVATVCVAGALILTRNRSAWLGSAFGLITVGALVLRTVSVRDLMAQKHRWMAPAIALALVVGLFFALSGTGSAIADRAKTLAAPTANHTFQWRQQHWAGSMKMASERPITGFGPGGYALNAGNYVEKTPSRREVELMGATMLSNPHNVYAQTAAEMGFVGLALYLAVLGGFFVRAFRALSRVNGDARKWMLIASMGAIAAQSVDAIGNPAWHFGEVSPLFWLVLGLGMAASRSHRDRREDGEEVRPAAKPATARYGRMAWTAGCAALGVALTLASFATAHNGSQRGNGTTNHDPNDCYHFGETPRVTIVPRTQALRFANTRVGRSRTLEFTIRNTGTAGSFLCGIVEVRNKTNQPDRPAFLLLGVGGAQVSPKFELERGESQTFRIRFQPGRRRDFVGEAAILFDGFYSIEQPPNDVVRLRGTGIGG